MKASKLFSFFFFLSLSFGFAQVPANDECANRETITIGTATYEQYIVNFTEATESLDASCENPANENKDVWFEFVMPIDGSLFISNVNNANYFSLYDSCEGTEIMCSNDITSFVGLSAGTTYILRASYRFNGNSFIRFQAFELATNDECVNKDSIVVETANYNQYSIDSRTASESMDASCDDAVDDNLDLWYEFVMPVNGNVEITGVSQFQFQTFSLFDTCGGQELACVYDRGFFMNLTAGTTFILRISDEENRAGPINYRIQAFEFATYNECVNSQTITVETANFNNYEVNLKAAYESTDSSCETETNDNLDLWYDFVMPVNGNLSLKQLDSNQIVTVYDACGGNEVSCKSGAQLIYGLTSSTSYKMRISSTTPVIRSLRIQAFEEAPNDECENSELITVETANYSEYPADTRRATESLDTSCETVSNDNLDLWYEFTMPVSGNLQVSSVPFQFTSTLYDNCSGAELDCINGSDSFLNLAFGMTYKLRVARRSNDASLVNMRLQAFENIFNDECITPQDIVVNFDTFSTYASNVSAATESAVSNCEPSSELFTIQDVWYRFTMPIDGDIEVDDLTTVANSTYYALYATCGTTEIQCITNDGLFTDLVAGTSYVLKTGLLSSQSGVLSFRIRAKSGSLSIDENEANNISIYPNPVTEILNISNKNNSDIQEVLIYDIMGRLIHKKTIGNTLNLITIDMSYLKPASYILIIKSDKVSITKRIIKE